jgi:hypothetical protein
MDDLLESCRQNPQLADAVHSFIEYMEHLEEADPGSGFELMQAFQKGGRANKRVGRAERIRSQLYGQLNRKAPKRKNEG